MERFVDPSRTGSACGGDGLGSGVRRKNEESLVGGGEVKPEEKNLTRSSKRKQDEFLFMVLPAPSRRCCDYHVQPILHLSALPTTWREATNYLSQNSDR